VATDTAFLRRNYAQTRADLDVLGLPMGWEGVEFHPPWEKRAVGRTGDGAAVLASVWPSIWHYPWWSFVLLPLLGWICTGLAATFGAPFWFDLLNKVMVIRSTVKPREKSPEEGSEDRQPRGTKPAGGEGGGAAAETHAAPPPERRPVPRLSGTRASALSTPGPESEVDGCDAVSAGVTSDEELPAARGGVE
jgi:hypothetical protein